MFGHDFYHATIRKTTALVGTLFNDITVVRRNQDGTEAQKVRVGLVYGPTERALQLIEKNPSSDRPISITLPMMSFELVDVRYDSTRKLPSTGRIYTKAPNGSNSKVYNPVPYDLLYELNLYTDQLEDGYKVMEQVLPFFTPSWSATVKYIDDMPTVDVYVELASVSQDDTFEGSPETGQRRITWKLQLRVRTYFFGPVTGAKTIRFAETNLYAGMQAGPKQLDFRSIWSPGLLANGSPTSNASASVSPLLINETDDWGYTLVIE